MHLYSLPESTRVLFELHHLKATEARMLLFKTIQLFHGPFRSDEILTALHKQHISVHRATVFRDLDTFVVHGILTELAVRGVKARLFERADEPHPVHFVCSSCGVTALNLPELETSIQQEVSMLANRGYATKSYGIKIYGKCPACQGRKKGKI